MIPKKHKIFKKTILKVTTKCNQQMLLETNFKVPLISQTTILLSKPYNSNRFNSNWVKVILVIYFLIKTYLPHKTFPGNNKFF